MGGAALAGDVGRGAACGGDGCGEASGGTSRLSRKVLGGGKADGGEEDERLHFDGGLFG